jgi:hypothetical protein
VHVYRRNRAEGPETCLGVWGRTRATRVSFGGDVREEANSDRSKIRYFLETVVPYEQPRFLRRL